MAADRPPASRGLSVRHALGLVALLCGRVVSADGYFEPTDTPLPFDFSSDAPFSVYLDVTADYLMAHREFIRPGRKASELELVMPFDLAPPDSCDGPRRGALLVHGILETPYAMRDIAEVLNARCFLVRAILLPGHGTRAGDLLTVTADDWEAAVAYGIRSLHADVDEVHVGGFSLGGLLSALAALRDPDIEAALLFAPALGVTYPLLAHQSSWLKHLKDWLDRNPAPLPVRYQSMATNAVAQIVELTKRYDAEADAGFPVPAFVVASVDDIAVRTDKVIDEFVERFTHPASRLIVYGQLEESSDDRITAYRSFMPEQKVLNIAHMSIPYHPDNRYFGRDGLYRDCGQYLPIIPNDEVAACQRNDENWRGELDSTNDKTYLPLQRLTFNPLFEETVEDMNEFLESLTNTEGAAP